MNPSLQQAFNPKHNSFDFLRFFFAAAVLFTHSFDLTQLAAEPFGVFSNHQEDFARMAVNAFFALSGFLIARSNARSKTVLQFFGHRALRILPGFWLCLLITVVIFVPLIFFLERGTLTGLLSMSGPSLWTYIPANISTRIGQHQIGDLLKTVPIATVINGSLWTLYNEMRCYIAIGLLGLVGATRNRRWLLPLVWAGFYCVYLFYGSEADTLSNKLPGLQPSFVTHLCYFFGGATVWAYADKLPARAWVAALAALALLSTLALGSGYRPIAALLWPYLLIWLATALPFARWGRHGDFSYGLYVYGFPVQQTLIVAGLPALGIVPFFLGSLLVTLLPAVLSFKLIEAPTLRLKQSTQ